MEIEIYTDGACSGNPGSGGFGVLIVQDGKKLKKYSKGYRLTTNNRMELMAAIFALSKIEGSKNKITIYSDSKYLTDAINQNWIKKWIQTGFSNIKNPDLWQKFVNLYQQQDIDMVWVKGHNGCPENEECDKLAVEACRCPRNIDHGYERK